MLQFGWLRHLRVESVTALTSHGWQGSGVLKLRLIAQSRANNSLPFTSCLYPILQILCSLFEEAGTDLPLVANPEVLDTLMLALVGSGGMDARAAR